MFGQSGLNFGTVFRQFGLKFQDVVGQVGQNFQKCFRVFLDSMESPLSQKLDKTYSFYGAFNV